MNNNEEEIDWIIDRTPVIDTNHSFSNLITEDDFQLTTTENHNTNEEDFIPFDYIDIHCIQSQSTFETDVRKIIVSEEERDCPICIETREKEEISQVNCGHKFCAFCLTKYIRNNNRLPYCPLCREIIDKITFQTHYYEFYFLDF
jgi:hypothetical protein